LSTLYIRLPSKTATEIAPNWPALACPFALVSNGSAIERQGTAPLPDLADTIAKAQRVLLLLAASDVTVLRLQVPPLSSARLKAALPNMVEDRLIADPADCVVVAGGLADGLRTVAVVQRAWLDILAKTLIAFGARHIVALPAQLCLPYQSAQTGQPGQPGSVVAAISDRNAGDQNNGEQNADFDMTLRLSEQDGIGLAINVDQNESAAHEVIRTLCAVVPEAPITLYVPESLVLAYQEAVNDPVDLHQGSPNKVALNKRIDIFADNWSRWIAGAGVTTLDLMAGLGLGTGPVLDWRAWRWPLALAAAVLLINVTALNIDWWHMKGEANALRASMIQIYKSAYPKESVIIDPTAQMQQKIAAAKHNSGLAAADDFTAITAAFGEAWSSAVVAAGKTTAIAALEYRERSLFVRLKPALSRVEGSGSEAPTQQMKAALTKRDLLLDLAPGQSGAVVWQIRSAK
jgi:general secretion pathway protein L